MGKINIVTSTGSTEALPLISAFKADNNNYVILDSEKTGSMGLPIINVCKLTTKLEKISDPNEWQNVKNYLKGIISGTNFEYINVSENVNADEAYFTPLTLPQASFDLIRSRYNVGDTSGNAIELTPDVVSPVTPEVAVTPTITPEVPIVSPDIPQVTPVMPDAPISNIEVATTPIVEPPVMEPIVEPIPSVTPLDNPVMPEVAVTPATPVVPSSTKQSTMNFDNDKETFLKACENMFDALVSKYQKEINAKEEELNRKEQEINVKMQDATEHLANAEAREQVANIALDNANQVMDLNGVIPQIPTPDIPTSV